MEEKFYRPEIAFLWHFCTLEWRFSLFNNCFWRRKWRKNSEKRSRYSSHSDLSIESLHVAIGALVGLKSRFLWHFLAFKSRFSNLKRRKRQKNSGKNSRCSSYLDLSTGWITLPYEVQNRVAYNFKSAETTFFQQKISFLEKGANEKFWKKFQ